MTLPFEVLQTLPFADGKFKTTPKITEPITFELEKEPSEKVTLFPVHDSKTVPKNLLKVVQEEVNYVIDEGLTYPYYERLDFEQFVDYWFHAFAAILISGSYESLEDRELQDKLIEWWKESFLGTFYVKPNYVGRCSHTCNAGFIVNHKKRGLGIGKELGAKYLVWAPKLGYAYSVFNLVFETNLASLKIWDNLGFDRIGYVKDVAVLKGHDKLVGAYMFGKSLTTIDIH
ncbi:uncharacterized protein PRCAT00005201001 [Priceomyces carsonii]|uniref:uncharacterized protein n=1 Tax=Priceomyces carsonii TaxID=28549 RepID=UPI002EDA414E|nr:unnamed protein product [Priceomyces carsonii]